MWSSVSVVLYFSVAVGVNSENLEHANFTNSIGEKRYGYSDHSPLYTFPTPPPNTTPATLPNSQSPMSLNPIPWDGSKKPPPYGNQNAPLYSDQDPPPNGNWGPSYKNQHPRQYDKQDSSWYGDRETSRYRSQDPPQYGEQDPPQYGNWGPSSYKNQHPRQYDKQDPSRYGDRETSRYRSQDPPQYGEQDPPQYGNWGPSSYKNQDPRQYDKQDPSRYCDRETSRYRSQDPQQYGSQNPSRYGDRETSRYRSQDPPQYGEQDPSGYGDSETSRYRSQDSPQYGRQNPSRYGDRETSRYRSQDPRQYGDQYPSRYGDRETSRYRSQDSPQYGRQNPSRYGDREISRYRIQDPPQYGEQDPPQYGNWGPSPYENQDPPQYGDQDPPQYGEDPPQYGEDPPPYGEDPPPYGEDPPPYGEDPPPYGEDPPPYVDQKPPPYGNQDQPQNGDQDSPQNRDQGPPQFGDQKKYLLPYGVFNPSTPKPVQSPLQNFNRSSIAEDPCSPNFSEKPNFLVSGRRISEAKCMDYIWTLNRMQEIRRNTELCEAETERKRLGYYRAIPAAVGGRAAFPGEFPHMGAIGWLGINGEWLFKCGCSLISPKFVITAAHCSKASSLSTDLADPVPKKVRLSHVNIDLATRREQPLIYDVDIQKIIVHPKYKPPKKYYDIALMELDHEVGFSQMVQPACLWTTPDTSQLGLEATLTGWGVLQEGSLDFSPILQAAVVNFIEVQQCDSLLSKKRNRNWSGLQEHQICAGKLAGGVDACQGDSGGPLQVQINLDNIPTTYKMYYVVGVTAFGFGCARRNLPGVYTKVSSFADWIEPIVWKS